MSQNSTTSSYTFTPINDNGDGESNTMAKTLTKFDKSVASVARLHKNTAVLKRTASDCITETLDIIDRYRFKGKSTVVAKLEGIRSTLTTVASEIAEDAVSLSPIPSIAYAYSRQQAEERRRSITPDVEVNDNGKKRRQPSRLKAPPSKRFKIGEQEIVYAPPANGIEYTPKEFVDIIVANVAHKSKLINRLIEEKTVPGKRRGLYSILEKVEKGKAIPKHWRDRGRPPLATEDDMAKIAASLVDKPGSSIGRQDISNKLLEIRKQSLIDNGIAPIGTIAKPSNTTVRNYSGHLLAYQN